MTTAVLITSYNRYSTTKSFLVSLLDCLEGLDMVFDIYLFDDASPDRTGERIKNEFPNIKIYYGDGTFYWSGGMRFLMGKVITKKQYDFIIWSNDDILLKKDSVKSVFKDYKTPINKGIIVGTFASKKSKEITYGLRNQDFRFVFQEGQINKGSYIEGNFVLIAKDIYNKIGNINPFYTHALGDSDYSLRARKMNVGIYSSSKIIGYCELNEIQQWKNPKNNLIKRVRCFITDKKFSLLEFMHFIYRDRGLYYSLKFFLSTSFVVLTPKIYNKLRK